MEEWIMAHEANVRLSLDTTVKYVVGLNYRLNQTLCKKDIRICGCKVIVLNEMVFLQVKPMNLKFTIRETVEMGNSFRWSKFQKGIFKAVVVVFT